MYLLRYAFPKVKYRAGINEYLIMADEVNSILIVGIGNEFRSDDAIGIIVSRKLKEKIGNRAKIIEHNGDGVSLMEKWNGFSKVILIDAVAFGNTPGKIHHIDAVNNLIPKETIHHSSHLFSVADAIETSRVLKKLPPSLCIYGIEGKSFEPGSEISQEVINSLEKAVTQIINDLDN
jgi:hydrogenase maturation protease